MARSQQLDVLCGRLVVNTSTRTAAKKLKAECIPVDKCQTDVDIAQNATPQTGECVTLLESNKPKTNFINSFGS